MPVYIIGANILEYTEDTQWISIWERDKHYLRFEDS